VNEAVLVPVPPGVVTAIGPPVAPVGTVQVIWLYEVTMKTAGVPLKVTAVAPVKALPVIVTVVPVLPELGLKAETVGITPNVAGLDPLPAGVATLMVPVSAPEGTVAVMVESETTVNAAAVLLKATAAAPVNALPLMVTEDPTAADGGDTPVMLGAGCDVTLKDAGLLEVPPGVVTLIGPVVAPDGTVAVSWLPEVTVKAVAVPLKDTAVVPVKPLPTTVTEVPAQPEAGVNEEMVGAGAGAGLVMGRGVAVAPLLGAVPRPK